MLGYLWSLLRRGVDSLLQTRDRWTFLVSLAVALVGGVGLVWPAAIALVPPPLRRPLAAAVLLLLALFAMAREAYRRQRDVAAENVALRAAADDSLDVLQDELTFGPASPLAPHDRLAEARRQYLATAEAAKRGDVRARVLLVRRARRLIEASEKYNAHNAEFAQDHARVMSDLKALGLGGDGGIA